MPQMMNTPCTPDASNAVAFVVVSCDKYSDLWMPFFHFLDEHWSDCPYSVYLITNKMSFDHPGVKVIRVGEDRSYSDNIALALPSIREKWIILWLEDLMFFRKVDTSRLNSIIMDAQSIPVGYLKLGPDFPLSYETRGRPEIGPLPKGIRYRSAVGTALYHVETLGKLLIPAASAWELDTSTRSNDLDEPFYALTVDAARNPPVEWVNTVVKGRWTWAGLKFLKENGFDHLLESRQRQGLGDTLYIKLFLLYCFILKKLKRYWH